MIEIPEWYNASVLVDGNLEAGRADKVAIFCGDDEITYGELARRTNRFGHALRELGVDREDRVLLMLNDTPSFPTAFFAVMRIGAVPIPVNTLLQPADYRFFVENSRARVVVCDQMHHETIRKALDGYDEELVEVIVTNGRAEEPLILEELLEAGEDELDPVATHRDDPAFWLYSSGSTGKPKGAVHLHHDIIYTCETYARHVLEVSEEDLFFSVPTLYNAMLNREGAGDYDLSSIRLCVSAAEALPAGIWRRWKEMFGSVILDGIGSTEMLHIFISNTPEEIKPGSSGKPVPGYEARILDETGYPVEPGEAGYLSVKGDSAAAYYWRNHEKTKLTMQGEWLFAGDWYRVDEDGFYWYEGRSDDMIKVSGLWVSPVEVESTLGDHPAVIEAAAVGVPVDGLTRVRAHIVLRQEYEPSEELVAELQNWCKERLKRYQYPHLVEFVEELPKTVTGKIQRFKLRRPEPEVQMPQQEDELV